MMIVTAKRVLPRPAAAVLVLCACLCAAAWSGAAEPAPASVAALQQRVMSLTAPSLAGRAAGSAGGHAATDTLAAWFAAAGLRSAFGDAFTQEFPLTGKGWTGDDLAGLTGRNVGGVIPGAGALAGRWLVVAAHLDHLGTVAPPSPPAGIPGPADYYPGANDNASGVAVTHETARRLCAGVGAPSRRSVLVLNTDGEESGLQGAAWFVAHPCVVLDSIDVMINLDTVGHLSDGRLIVSGLGTADPLEAAVNAAASASGVPVNPSRGGWSGSDHMVFNTREVPVLFLFGGAYPEYNRPADTAAALDYTAMARITVFTGALVEQLRIAPGDFAWRMVGGGGLRDQSEGGTSPTDAPGNRRTWLGTMPDFTEGQTGYRLAAVFEGSPAAAVGLQKGDVLVRFGDYDVSDLATFTTALRAYGPGDLVEIGILRDGRDTRFTVALGDRAQRR
jgi:hypothetical protein